MDEDEGNIAWEGERSRARPRNSTEALGVENNLKHATEVDHTRLVCLGVVRVLAIPCVRNFPTNITFYAYTLAPLERVPPEQSIRVALS